MTSLHDPGQTLDIYTDQLYFGILSGKPDSTIGDFISKYAPIVLRTFDSEPKWNAYPPDFFPQPKFETVTNSFVFYEHQHFDGEFTSGQLSITQKIYNDPNWIDIIVESKLWLQFDHENDAKNSYKKLVDTFSSFEVQKRFTSENDFDKAEFSDEHSNKYHGRIQIVLAKDCFNIQKYMIPSENGPMFSTEIGYKILIEIGNDLY